MPNTGKSDSELARQAAAGDQAAFIVLVERHQGMVSGVALSLMKNVAASEDIAQETFLSAWKKIGEPSRSHQSASLACHHCPQHRTQLICV